MGFTGLVFTVVAGAFIIACGLALFTVGLVERRLIAGPRKATPRNGI
jgi:hypothetical protein